MEVISLRFEDHARTPSRDRRPRKRQEFGRTSEIHARQNRALTRLRTKKEPSRYDAPGRRLAAREDRNPPRLNRLKYQGHLPNNSLNTCGATGLVLSRKMTNQEFDKALARLQYGDDIDIESECELRVLVAALLIMAAVRPCSPLAHDARACFGWIESGDSLGRLDNGV
jgi:hypothetical protein